MGRRVEPPSKSDLVKWWDGAGKHFGMSAGDQQLRKDTLISSTEALGLTNLEVDRWMGHTSGHTKIVGLLAAPLTVDQSAAMLLRDNPLPFIVIVYVPSPSNAGHFFTDSETAPRPSPRPRQFLSDPSPPPDPSSPTPRPHRLYSRNLVAKCTALCAVRQWRLTISSCRPKLTNGILLMVEFL